LWHIEIPLAIPNILVGVKTSVVTAMGTATLAALIGAGGYGVPIVTGLAMNDTQMILSGAIPAAVMTLAWDVIFSYLNKYLIPRGLRARS
jgi:osmoprotectant transport system permease protein